MIIMIKTSAFKQTVVIQIDKHEKKQQQQQQCLPPPTPPPPPTHTHTME